MTKNITNLDELNDPMLLRKVTAEGLKLVRMTELSTNIYQPVSYKDLKEFHPYSFQIYLRSQGMFTFPTTELIEFLENEIDEYTEGYEPAIEICCGNGWIGRNLGIPFVDNKTTSEVHKNEYSPVTGMFNPGYPEDVIEMDAIEAIKSYKPEYVIASYPIEQWRLESGKLHGVNFDEVLRMVHKFIMIGSLSSHSRFKIMKRPHKELKFPWLITRGDASLSRIFIWENKCW